MPQPSYKNKNIICGIERILIERLYRELGRITSVNNKMNAGFKEVHQKIDDSTKDDIKNKNKIV